MPVFGLPISETFGYTDSATGEISIRQRFERNRFELHPDNQAPYDVQLGRLGAELLPFANVAPRESGPQAGCLWFAQTERNVCDQRADVGFKTYWQTHGLEFDGQPGKTFEESLALFGLPLTSVKIERNISGDTVLTQWFERARFEYHPNKPHDYTVLLGLLGNEYPVEEEPEPHPSEPPAADACAGIPAPRSAVTEYNCVQQGETLLVAVYDFEPYEEINYWITKQDGGTVGGNQAVQTDKNGEFRWRISTTYWGMSRGDYVFVAQAAKGHKEPATLPFRVLP